MINFFFIIGNVIVINNVSRIIKVHYMEKINWKINRCRCYSWRAI